MRYLTAGESHGKGLCATLDGFPAQLSIDRQKINQYLALRQAGYGRGGRMKIETDRVEFLTGVRGNVTTGAPITLWIENKDYQNWIPYMNSEKIEPGREVTCPRPGHADLYGALKYEHTDIRNVLERASARETAARVAAGALCIQLLNALGIRSYSHVIALGGVTAQSDVHQPDFTDQITASPVRCADPAASEKMTAAIDRAKANGDSLGGVAQILFCNVCPGIGSYAQWDQKLDARLAFALTSIQSVKGVSFGAGFEAANLPGSRVHDEIYYSDDRGFYKKTNRAGGIEGGMTNGQDVVMQVAFKPIPTLYQPLQTADLLTGEKISAAVERSDTCAVPAASVVAECAAAIVLVQAICDQFGSGTIRELEQRYREFSEKMKKNGRT